jgi:p-aminobenzoyl-glutamate transporter AbgT
MDEEYWAAYRKHARKRANAWGALVFCPFIIAVAVLSFTQRPNFQVLRDSPALHVLVSGVFLAFGIVGLVGSVRWLLADRQRPS